MEKGEPSIINENHLHKLGIDKSSLETILTDQKTPILTTDQHGDAKIKLLSYMEVRARNNNAPLVVYREIPMSVGMQYSFGLYNFKSKTYNLGVSGSDNCKN
jgi:hypothetical protein